MIRLKTESFVRVLSVGYFAARPLCRRGGRVGTDRHCYRDRLVEETGCLNHCHVTGNITGAAKVIHVLVAHLKKKKIKLE